MNKIMSSIVPHRLLINRSLHKECDKFRDAIRSYENNYEQKIGDYAVELQRQETIRNEQVNHFRKSLDKELQEESQTLSDLYDVMIHYTDLYFDRQLLTYERDIYYRQRDLLRDYRGFLTRQMSLIGEDIEILQARKSELCALVDIEAVVSILKVNGIDISEDHVNIDGLKEEISKRLYEYEDDKILTSSLLRLVRILQEKSEYNGSIKYIDWVIRQKIIYSRELKKYRTQKEKKIKVQSGKIKEINETINSVSREMDKVSFEIRSYWTKPIILSIANVDYYNNEQSHLIREIKEQRNKKKEICEELHHKSVLHLDWGFLGDEADALTREIGSLQSEIDRLNDEIRQERNTQNEWNDKGYAVVQIFRNNGTYFDTRKETRQSDIRHMTTSYLKELEDEYNACAIKAEADKQKELADETATYEAEIEPVNAEIGCLNQQIIDANYRLTDEQIELESCKQDLHNSMVNDNRIFLAKLVSDSEAITRAKKEISKCEKNLVDIENERKRYADSLMIKKAEAENIKKSHEDKQHQIIRKYSALLSKKKHNIKVLRFEVEHHRSRK